jgi:hypothetical protein
MRSTNKSYHEGDWFAVPLNNGGHALGLIARMKEGRGTRIIFGYFFGPRLQDLSRIAQLAELSPEDAIHVGRFGDRDLRTGRWPVIGTSETWDRAAWPMPPFVRIQLVSGIAYKVVYDQDDPGKMISETKCDPSEADSHPRDALSGGGAIETILTDKLRAEPK